MISDLLIIFCFACFFTVGYAVGKRNAISDKVKHMLNDLETTWKKRRNLTHGLCVFESFHGETRRCQSACRGAGVRLLEIKGGKYKNDSTNC